MDPGNLGFPFDDRCALCREDFFFCLETKTMLYRMDVAVVLMFLPCLILFVCVVENFCC